MKFKQILTEKDLDFMEQGKHFESIYDSLENIKGIVKDLDSNMHLKQRHKFQIDDKLIIGWKEDLKNIEFILTKMSKDIR